MHRSVAASAATEVNRDATDLRQEVCRYARECAGVGSDAVDTEQCCGITTGWSPIKHLKPAAGGSDTLVARFHARPFCRRLFADRDTNDRVDSRIGHEELPAIERHGDAKRLAQLRCNGRQQRRAIGVQRQDRTE